jgi:hypothetical protein
VINETPEGKKGKRAVDPKDFMVSKQMKWEANQWYLKGSTPYTKG